MKDYICISVDCKLASDIKKKKLMSQMRVCYAVKICFYKKHLSFLLWIINIYSDHACDVLFLQYYFTSDFVRRYISEIDFHGVFCLHAPFNLAVKLRCVASSGLYTHLPDILLRLCPKSHPNYPTNFFIQKFSIGFWILINKQSIIYPILLL